VEARKKEGSKYKLSSLKDSIFLLRKWMIDIIRYHILVFKNANYIFAAMTIQLK